MRQPGCPSSSVLKVGCFSVAQWPQSHHNHSGSCRKQHRYFHQLVIRGAKVESVGTLNKVTTSHDLSWTHHINATLKKSRQHIDLLPLKVLRNFYPLQLYAYFVWEHHHIYAKSHRLRAKKTLTHLHVTLSSPRPHQAEMNQVLILWHPWTL